MHLLAIYNTLFQFFSVALLAVGALLPIVDPLGGAPIYLAMTIGLTTEQRNSMAKAVAINSFLLLLASALIGAYVLDFFGLSIPAVQVAGGVVVCAIAWSLLNSPNAPSNLARSGAPSPSPDDLSQRAFYPMTMPLTVGPGSISLTALGHALGIFVVALGVFLCYRYADRILRRLGPTGTSVVVRLTAFILLCIGVQICWNGIRGLINAGFAASAS
jgi:multiple antibiotic resistance protein